MPSHWCRSMSMSVSVTAWPGLSLWASVCFHYFLQLDRIREMLPTREVLVTASSLRGSDDFAEMCSLRRRVRASKGRAYAFSHSHVCTYCTHLWLPSHPHVWLSRLLYMCACIVTAPLPVRNSSRRCLRIGWTCYAGGTRVTKPINGNEQASEQMNGWIHTGALKKWVPQRSIRGANRWRWPETCQPSPVGQRVQCTTELSWLCQYWLSPWIVPVSLHVYIYIYIYICIERERERESPINPCWDRMAYVANAYRVLQYVSIRVRTHTHTHARTQAAAPTQFLWKAWYRNECRTPCLMQYVSLSLSLYIYIYIYIYTCNIMCIYIYTYLSLSLYIYIMLRVCVYIYIYT